MASGGEEQLCESSSHDPYRAKSCHSITLPIIPAIAPVFRWSFGKCSDMVCLLPRSLYLGHIPNPSMVPEVMSLTW